MIIQPSKSTEIRDDKNMLHRIDSVLLFTQCITAGINPFAVYTIVTQLADIGFRSRYSSSFNQYEGSTASRTVYKAGRFLKEKLNLD